MCWIGLLKHKAEAFEKFKVFKDLVENESDRKIKCLKYDRGEFTSDEFFDFCEEHGIKAILHCKDSSAKWSDRKDEENCSTNGSCYAR